MKTKAQKTKRFLVPIISLVIATILIISTITTYLNIKMFTNHMNEDILVKKEKYLKAHKDKIYKYVHLVDNSIKFQISKMELKLKQSLEERIQTALNIAKHIYNTQKGKLSNDEIKKRIAEHLLSISFNEGRGYYYTFDYDTNIIIGHPIKKFQGRDMTNFRDTKGLNLVESQKASIKHTKIGFSKLYFNKPNQPNKEFPKIVAVSKFEPLNIVIGTGEYLDTIEKQIQDYVIDRFKYKVNDKKHYLFFLKLHNINGGDNFATILLNSNRPDLIGQKVDDSLKDAEGKEFRKDFLAELRANGESYTKYLYRLSATDQVKPKLTYFYHQKDWNWIIASGFHYDDLDKEISLMEHRLEAYTQKTILDSSIWIVVLSFLVLIIAVIVSLRIDETIQSYTDELIKQKLELELAQEVAKMGSWSLDLVTNELKWSSETYKIFEIDKTKALSTYEDFLNLIHPEDKDMTNTAYTKSLEDKVPYNVVYRLLMPDGRVKWVEERCTTIFNNEGKAIISNGTIQDITQEYNKNIELQEQEKLASMGEMIGNIAHQWRQPLSVISTAATGMQLQKEYGHLNDNLFNESCETINKNAQYLSKTIDDFRNFIKGDRVFQYFNLKENIQSFKHLVEGAIKSNDINVIFNLDSNIGVNGYPNELVQCYINIFNNAKDALIENNIENKLIFISTYIENNKIRIIFKDNAGGIPKDIKSKIFDPYFTTKHQSKGTGLGLNMSNRLISEGMNGSIDVVNAEYEYEGNLYAGAQFKITLPIT